MNRYCGIFIGNTTPTKRFLQKTPEKWANCAFVLSKLEFYSVNPIIYQCYKN